MILQSLLGLAAIGSLFYLMIREREDHAEQRAAWGRERSQLLNRIKPETAQTVPGEPVWPSPKGVVPDDDDAFWRAHGIDTSEVR